MSVWPPRKRPNASRHFRYARSKRRTGATGRGPPDMAGNEAIYALLVAYADGELDETSVAEVEAYLAATPEAQRTLAIYRETTALLRAAFPESRYERDVRTRIMPKPRGLR